MSETKREPRVAKSPTTNSYFYFTRHREVSEKAIAIVGNKTDVTDSVEALVEEEILSFLQWVKDAYGLDLRNPEAREGYRHLNDLVAEWRRG